MDQKININTKDGIKEVTTNKLKGKLKAVIISSLENNRLSKTRILIESELGYKLLDYPDFYNTIYIPISAQRIDKYSHLASEWTDYYLDEKLKITVSGGRNQEIQIIIRIV